MPTTLDDDYTCVPSRADFALFQSAHVSCLSDIFSAGMQVYNAVSDTCRPDFEAALYSGKETKSVVVLAEKNGWTLELHMPASKRPVLAAFPPEHISHIMWSALKSESRLWVLEGGVHVYSLQAAIMGTTPPQVEKLIGLIDASPHKLWFRGGAYAEAVMKTVRRMQYHTLYGVEEGEKKWADYYYGAKKRAGAHTHTHTLTPLTQ